MILSAHEFRPAHPASLDHRGAVFTDHITARVRKYSHHGEWLVMNLVSQFTSIPVPRVFGEGFDKTSGRHWFEMELVPGESLEDVWDRLGDLDRENIQEQLRDILLELRQVNPEIIPRSPLIYDNFFWPRCKDLQEKYPSVHTCDKFIEHLVMTLIKTSSVYEPARTAQVVRMLKTLPSGQPLVFTHGNLDPRNIIIDFVDGKAKIVAVLDWAQAGYYPAYWEYVKAHWEEDSDVIFDGGFEDVFPTPDPLALSVVLHAKDLIW
jgi:aminoglycoside phosphotransferase (APT) family kinase protein